MELVDVYVSYMAHEFLFDLLKERAKEQNISHKYMPTFQDHVEFVDSHPYRAWYLVEKDKTPIGAVYLTREDELGVFILKKHHRQGWGSWALKEIMELHPRDRFLANINPENEVSKKLFAKIGFNKLSETMEYVEPHGEG